ncbi:Sodium/hydrogen exchanger 2 [Zea mays]|uniref:Sodium/hydrogen exchanger 2 n=1 Tax=Zea mays TaxID=4577 RepID=A0A1D6IH47_MAIZE|nr:Sodium/hydrogen exchanger 2 [Zea mays]
MFLRFCGSARHFGRDIIMPNLKSSVTTTASAVEYMDEVLKALPLGEARNEDSRTLQFNYGSFKHKALDKSLTKKVPKNRLTSNTKLTQCCSIVGIFEALTAFPFSPSPFLLCEAVPQTLYHLISVPTLYHPPGKKH